MQTAPSTCERQPAGASWLPKDGKKCAPPVGGARRCDTLNYMVPADDTTGRAPPARIHARLRPKGSAMSFRDNLQHLRAERHMTQEQLAMLLGVSRQSVTKWEAESCVSLLMRT